MRQRLTGPARRDIERALDWSHAQHGPYARRRYERLITSALKTLRSAKDPPGSQAFEEDGRGVRVFHLRHSRKAAGKPPVSAPRHFVVYRRPEPDLIVIVRVLHDAMDLPARLLEPF